MEHDAFYLRVARALSACQLVEQELKLYITEALELVVKCLDGKLPFHMRGNDYADASLERLIETFKKLSNESQLVTDLRNFKDERNFLSHRGIASCLDYEGELDWSASAEAAARLSAIEMEAERLRTAVHEAANKFRAFLWFDPIPEGA